MVAAVAEAETPLIPAIEVLRLFVICTRPSSTTRGDNSVAPAPVSMAKLKGPAPLTQVLTSRPRPGTSRNMTDRGIALASAVTRGNATWLLRTGERATPNEVALTPVVRTRRTAKSRLGLLVIRGSL